MRTAHLLAIHKDGKRTILETKSDTYTDVKATADKLLKNPPAGVVAVQLWTSDRGLKNTLKFPAAK